MTPRSVIGGLAVLATAVLLTAMLQLANVAIFVAGGSDAATLIAAPPKTAQAASLVLVVGWALLALLGRAPAWRWPRRGLLALALFAVLLSGHRFVYDAPDGELRDWWCGVTLRRIVLAPDEGLAATYLYRETPIAMILTPRVLEQGGPAAITLFRGIPPWAIDTRPLRFLWQQIEPR